MTRTADRPLPAGRLSPRGSARLCRVDARSLGTIYLATALSISPALGWALATWVVYVAVYTPLKTASPANTAVGAVAGALPVLIGWSATGAALDERALALSLVLFLWQFPHFMAIAWLYRQEYARAGLQMLTVVDPSGRRAGWQAVLSALALDPGQPCARARQSRPGKRAVRGAGAACWAWGSSPWPRRSGSRSTDARRPAAAAGVARLSADAAGDADARAVAVTNRRTKIRNPRTKFDTLKSHGTRNRTRTTITATAT